MEYKQDGDEEDGIQNDETSQQWLIRQLRRHLDHIPDQVLREFVHQQDITPLRNFMTRTERRRCLFILIEEIASSSIEHKFFNENELIEVNSEDKKVLEPLSQQEVQNQIEKDLMNLENHKKPPIPNSEKKMRRFHSKKVKKDQKKDKVEPKTDKKSPPVIEKKSEDPNPTIPQPLHPQIDAPEFLGAHTSYSLKWYEEADIPQTKFMFMATRDEILIGTKSEFDKMFLTGYCKDLTKYNNAMEIGRLLLHEINFEQKMNLIMQLETNEAANKMEKWQNPESRFENFILDSLVGSFQSSLQRLNTDSFVDSAELDVESIETLLKSRVKLFTQSPTTESLTQLKLELSLIEMKYISNEMFDESVVGRIERSSSLLSVLSMLYQHISREWIQKALFHCIELTARTVATNVHQRVWNVVHEDNPNCDRKVSNISDEIHVRIIGKTQPQLVKLLKLGFCVLSEGSDEYICLQKIEQCVKIINYIQEELESFKDLYKDLKTPIRDMTFDRRKLQEVQGIVRTLWHSFEESYFESSLESGNYDSMKSVCLQMVQFISDMKESMPSIDLYCSSDITSSSTE